MNDQSTHETQANEMFLASLRHNARTIQPHPDFVASFEEQMRQIRPTRPSRSFSLLRTLSMIAAALVVISAAFVAVPPLRAIAQEIISLLIPATSDRQRRDITGLTARRQSFATLQEAEAALGQDIAEPMTLPTGQRADGNTVTTMLDEAVYDPDSGTIILSYAPASQQPKGLASHPYKGWWMWINAIPSDAYHAFNDEEVAQGDGNVGASAQIETLTITIQGREVSAEFVRGGWDIQGGLGDTKIIDAGGSVNRAVQWVNDGRMRLTWEAEGSVYVIHTIEDEVFHLTRDDLVRIAESME